MYRVGIGSAEKIDETARPRAPETNVSDGVRLDVVEQLEDWHRTDARRRKRALAVCAHIAVDHLSSLVRRHRDAAVYVRDDEVAFLVLATHFRGVELSYRLLVEDVRVRDAVDTLDAGKPRQVAVFVDVRGIEGERRLRVFLRKNPGEHDAELRRMLGTADRRNSVVVELLVDRRDAAGLRAGAAAAPDKCIDRPRADTLCGEHVKDNALAKRHLVIHVGKREKHRRIVKKTLLEKARLVFKKTHLGRGRAGIDYQ